METDKRWQDKSGSYACQQAEQEPQGTHDYSAEDIKRLFEVGGVSTAELEHWIKCSRNLILYMKMAEYTHKEIDQRLGNSDVKIGKKEVLLFNKIKDGVVKPSDSLCEIKEKLDPYYNVSRQSWNVAIQKLVKAGLIR